MLSAEIIVSFFFAFDKLRFKKKSSASGGRSMVPAPSEQTCTL